MICLIYIFSIKYSSVEILKVALIKLVVLSFKQNSNCGQLKFMSVLQWKHVFTMEKVMKYSEKLIKTSLLLNWLYPHHSTFLNQAKKHSYLPHTAPLSILVLNDHTSIFRKVIAAGPLCVCTVYLILYVYLCFLSFYFFCRCCSCSSCVTHIYTLSCGVWNHSQWFGLMFTRLYNRRLSWEWGDLKAQKALLIRGLSLSSIP